MKKKKLHKGKIDILGIEDPSNCYFEKGLLEITYKFKSQSIFTARLFSSVILIWNNLTV